MSQKDGSIWSEAEVVGGPTGHDTFAAALEATPDNGGYIYLVETVRETGNVKLDKPVKIIGPGAPFSQSVDRPIPHIDLDGNTLQTTVEGITIQDLIITGGTVIIGEHDVYGGRHRMNLTVRESPGRGIEFRGGHLDSIYDIAARDCAGDGIVWNLDADGVDYFNQNTVQLMSHSCDGHGVLMKTKGEGLSQFAGNDFLRFDIEYGGERENGEPGLTIRDSVWTLHNKFFGYGVHDHGVDVDPAGNKGNLVNWHHIAQGSGPGDNTTFKMNGLIMARKKQVDRLDIHEDAIIITEARARIPNLSVTQSFDSP